MANAEIVATRKYGNVFIGGKPMKINLIYDAKHRDDPGDSTGDETAVLGKAKLGTMKLGAE